MNSSFYVAFTAWGTWAAVACAIFVVWRQNQAAKKLSSFQLFLQLSAQYDSADMHRKRSALARQLIADRNTMEIDDTLPVFFETLAHMTRRKLLDRDLVWTTFSVDVCSYWSAVQHYVFHIRKKFSDPTLFEEFEELSSSFNNEALHRGAGNSEVALTDSAIDSFLHLEARRAKDAEK